MTTTTNAHAALQAGGRDIQPPTEAEVLAFETAYRQARRCRTCTQPARLLCCYLYERLDRKAMREGLRAAFQQRANDAVAAGSAA